MSAGMSRWPRFVDEEVEPMSQNMTHTKQIARALVERTGMPYTRARKRVVAAMEANLLPEPFTDEALPGLVDILCRVEDVTTPLVALVAGGPGSQTVLHDPAAEVPDVPGLPAEESADAVPMVRVEKRWAKVPLPWYEVSRYDVAMVLRRAGVLMEAYMPVVKAFEVAAEGSPAPALRAAMADVAVAVGEGWTLPEALGAYPALFDDFVVAMVRLGVEGGFSDARLRQVADHLMGEPPRILLRLGEGNMVLERGPRPVPATC